MTAPLDSSPFPRPNARRASATRRRRWLVALALSALSGWAGGDLSSAARLDAADRPLRVVLPDGAPAPSADSPRPADSADDFSAAASVRTAAPPAVRTASSTAGSTREPRVADRNRTRARLATQPELLQGPVRRAPAMDPSGQAPVDPGPLVPEEYRADAVAQDIVEDGVTLSQNPIGLNILQSATAPLEPDQAPENFAARALQNQKPCVIGTSRYREDFAIPVDRAASEFCYRPLYFEEVNLERYGTSHGPWQPIMSGARFFASVPALPYMMTVSRPCVCRYWTHDYPAGRRAPCWEKEHPPFSAAGAGVEGLAVYGLILLIP